MVKTDHAPALGTRPPTIFVAACGWPGVIDPFVARLKAAGMRVEHSAADRADYDTVSQQIDGSDVAVFALNGPTDSTMTTLELRFVAGLESRSGAEPKAIFIPGPKDAELDDQLLRFVGPEHWPTYLPDDLDAAVTVLAAIDCPAT